MKPVTIERKTKETQIQLTLNWDPAQGQAFETGLPFFDHMLHAMSFHGGFSLQIQARGDLEVDPHHLVEDVGLVLGLALSQAQSELGGILRYGHSIIPMDEALSEVVIDACNRPYLVYNVKLPQERAGQFDLFLLREFFVALSSKAQINLHAHCRYGENAHHMVECLFKALGKAIKQAYTPRQGGQAAMSTKGSL